MLEKNFKAEKFFIYASLFVIAYLFCRLSRHQDLYTLFASGIPDDSLYYLKTAMNYSRGLGSTFDGINHTNGYHPLWFMILTTLLKLSIFGSDIVKNFYNALIVQSFVTSLFICTSIYLLEQLLENLFIAVSAMFGFLLFFLNKIVNLLETPFQLLFFVISIQMLYAILCSSSSLIIGKRLYYSLFTLSIMCSLTFLARTDSLILFLAFSVVLFLKPGFNVKTALAYLTPTFLTVAVYLFINKYYFHSFGTVSSMMKLDETIMLYEQNSLMDFLKEKLGFIFGPNDLFSIPEKIVIQFFAFLPALYFAIHLARRKQFTNEQLLFLGLSLFLLLKYLAYTAIYHKFRAQAYWYWVIDGCIYVYLILYLFSRLVKKHYGEKIYRTISLVAIILIAFLYIKDIAKKYIDYPARHNEKPIAETSILLDLSKFLQNDYFRNKRIGAFNSGILGYFSNQQITNLDGLINSMDYYRAVRAGKRDAWIKENIEIVVEYHARYINDLTQLGYTMYNVREKISNPIPNYDTPYHDNPDYRVYVKKEMEKDFERFLLSFKK